MREFKDRDGRAWQIDLTIGNVLHVKRHSEGRFDLFDPSQTFDGQPLQVVLITDLTVFWEVLWLLVEQQAAAADVSAVAFGQAMAADCLVNAQQVFFDEWRDFFRSLRRPDAALSVETQAKTLATAVKLVTAKIQAIDQTRMQQQIETKLERELSATFGSVQASLAATLEDTPGDSST